jgi:hypothetical protein
LLAIDEPERVWPRLGIDHELSQLDATRVRRALPEQ